MPQPTDIIYDIVIEKYDGTYPARIYIKFNTHGRRKIMGAKNAITGKNLPKPSPYSTPITSAITMLKWAVTNDPDQPNPEILAFLLTI